MLNSPTHCIVGASHLDAACRFLSVFGFNTRTDDLLSWEASATLYGLNGPARQATMRPRGPNGFSWIRVVETPQHAPAVGPYDHGPHAIDLYTRDIVRSVAMARSAGAECGEIAHYAVGPLQIAEAKVVGPSHIVLVFIQVDRRRPSLLDHDEERLHSDLHSAVWTVPSIDAIKAFWTRGLGFTQLLDARIVDPKVASFMQLPRPDSPLRLLVVADAAQRPARVEFIEFPEDQGEPAPVDRPMPAGLYALGFTSSDLGADMSGLPDLSWSAVVPARMAGSPHQVVTGVAPGGVRVELWQAK
jgi:hypothetical protein